MIEPRPNRLIQAWFNWYCRHALRKHFFAVRVETPADAFRPDRPRIYLCTHTSFWDGIVLNHVIPRLRPQPLYCLIDSLQVRRHPFFTRVGGIGIDRSNARDSLACADYAARLIQERSAALIVFPQGRIVPQDQRPIRVEAVDLNARGAFDRALERLERRLERYRERPRDARRRPKKYYVARRLVWSGGEETTSEPG